MLNIDVSSAQGFIHADTFNDNLDQAELAFAELKTKTGKGAEWLGWRTILQENNTALLDELSSLAGDIRQKADFFIVCGIGGSYLGAKAVIDALQPQAGAKSPKIRYAGHHMGGAYLERLVQEISTPKVDGSLPVVYLNVISKSGTTIETALAFRVLRDWMNQHYGNTATERIICTTSAEGGALNNIIKANGYRKFALPDDCGGRFSVLTPVGLLPIAVAGCDIKAMFAGAVAAYSQYEQTPDDVFDYVATRVSLYEDDYHVDAIASFEPELYAFGGWMQQLLGESEGKNGKGLVPLVLGYSTDLHSMGQLVQDGQRNLMETFLVVKSALSTLTVPMDESNADGLNYLAGKSYHEINQKALQGTQLAHKEGGVPIVNIILSELNEENMGRLIYFFELATALYVYCLDENPFDQPGVEAYKKEMYRLLGKN